MTHKKGSTSRPVGRPRGSVNPINRQIREAAPELLATLIEAAKGGDMQAMQILSKRLVPPIKASHEAVQIVTDEQLATMGPVQKAEAIAGEALAGRLSADVAQSLLQLVTVVCEISRTTEMVELLAKLEQRAEQQQGGRL